MSLTSHFRTSFKRSDADKAPPTVSPSRAKGKTKRSRRSRGPRVQVSRTASSLGAMNQAGAQLFIIIIVIINACSATPTVGIMPQFIILHPAYRPSTGANLSLPTCTHTHLSCGFAPCVTAEGTRRARSGVKKTTARKQTFRRGENLQGTGTTRPIIK